MPSASIQACLDRIRPSGRILEGELLLAEVLNCSRERVFSHPERLLSEDEWDRFNDVWHRVEEGEPLAYILGKKEFFGLEFNVDSRVLTPRPETEHLVEAVLRLVKDISSPRILDIGTGCGAIALSLAHTLPDAKVFASDVSEDAIQVASENAQKFGLKRVKLFKSDLLTDIALDDLRVDVLVANLPYIGREKFHFVEKSVEEYEPEVALFGGFDGLQLYKRLFEQINCSKNGPRWVLGEFGSLQREALEAIILGVFPEGIVQFHTDLAGLDRYFVLELNHVTQT